MLEANIKIIDELKTFIREVKETKVFSATAHAFTKTRKLPFDSTVYLIINLLKKSLSIELNEFFETIARTALCCSKSAFTQQRAKLKYDFFVWWNATLVNSFYHQYKGHLKRWQGFRLVAIDGSTSYLINKPEVKAYFGIQINQATSVVMGRIVSAYDVLNELTICSGLLPINHSEQQVAAQWITYCEPDMLMLYDRGFPAFTSIYLHLEQERPINFVMRCRENFNKEVVAFMQEKGKSKMVEFKPTDQAIKDLKKHGYNITPQTTVKVRLVKVPLSNGTTEVLITSLYEEHQYPTSVFKDLYFKRWGIETNYGAQKNSLQLECLSGQKVNSILQDFYACIFIGNLQSIISKQCNTELESKNTHRKYHYKVNRNVAIGMLKNRVILLFIHQQTRESLMELERLFIKNIEPIRPDRSYERVIKSKRAKGKYQTLTNYKRAI